MRDMCSRFCGLKKRSNFDTQFRDKKAGGFLADARKKMQSNAVGLLLSSAPSPALATSPPKRSSFERKMTVPTTTRAFFSSAARRLRGARKRRTIISSTRGGTPSAAGAITSSPCSYSYAHVRMRKDATTTTMRTCLLYTSPSPRDQ